MVTFAKHIFLTTNEFSPGRMSMTVMLSQEFLPNLSTVLLQQVSNKSSHTFSKTVLPPHLQQFSGNKSLPNLSWNEYYQPIILVIMMFIIGISLHMMTDRTERELVTMSTLLQLGSNIEHRVAAWHRVPHLEQHRQHCQQHHHDHDSDGSTPSVATRMNSQPGWSLYCSIWGTGEITWHDSVHLFLRGWPTCFHWGLFSSAFSKKSPKLLPTAFKGNLGWKGRQRCHLVGHKRRVNAGMVTDTIDTLVKSTYHIVKHNCFAKNKLYWVESGDKYWIPTR